MATPVFSDLKEVFSLTWQTLEEGKQVRHSSFHQGVLATQTPSGPQARYVVVRHVDMASRTLGFHSDYRAQKIAELREDPRVSWCFYGQGVQLRLDGVATIHTEDDIAKQAWQTTNAMSRRCYMATVGPSSISETPSSGLPENLLHRTPDLEETEIARQHFCVVRVCVDHLDALSLAASGHRRAGFRYSDNDWHSQWRIP